MPPLLREEKTWEPNNLIFVFFWDEINIFNPKNERVYIYIDTHHDTTGKQRITTTYANIEKKN